MIQSILVLGSGSAGLIAAISLKAKIPQLSIRIVRSPDIGVIGVGEGTTPSVTKHLFDFLKLSPRMFYQSAEPLWKIGIRFFWGSRKYYDYPLFTQLNAQWNDLPMPNGYYCEDDCTAAGLQGALMENGKCFLRNPSGGGPDIQPWFGFHIENKKLVDTLEAVARGLGVEFIDGKVSGAPKRGEKGISEVILDDGRTFTADFFVDASGFRSELLGKALAEPFISFNKSLFCDRAVVGGWDRTDEPIYPYTTSETMDAGWAWRIEHEHHVNRGYVYCSSAISDDDAKAEFMRKNPKVPESARIVKFRSGRYERGWVDNVVAIGNSGGFVEPMEASALMVVCAHCETLCNFLIHSRFDPTPAVVKLYNRAFVSVWDELRDFLALHYKINGRMDNPFWKHCREDTDLSGLDPLMEFYRETGPSVFLSHFMPQFQSQFGVDGYLIHLVGARVPYERKYTPSDSERKTWQMHRQQFLAQAQSGVDVKEALASIRSPGWAGAPMHAHPLPPIPCPSHLVTLSTHLVRSRPWSIRLALLSLLLLAAACEPQPPKLSGSGMDMFAPISIRLHPLSRIIVPDSAATSPAVNNSILEARLELADQFRDAGKGVGTLSLELYDLPGTGLTHRGPMLASWTLSIDAPEKNRDHWDRISRTYLFKLPIPVQLPKRDHLLLQATFTLPNHQQLTDELELPLK